jgi:serine protease Do
VSPSLLNAASRLSFSFALLAIAAPLVSAQRPSISFVSPPHAPVPPEASTTATTTTISRGVKDVFEKSAKAVVKVRGTDELGEFAGTGFFIDPFGTLYTAYSVAGEADSLSVDFGGKKESARVLLADSRSGIALLKVEATTPMLPIGKSDQVEVTTPVISIGFPLDLPQTPNFGMIAGFDRKIFGRYFFTTHLRVNVPTQRGEAGAPVLNFKGEVIGILISSIENGSACHALPINAAEKIRSDYVRFGEVRHGWIGVNVAEADEFKEGSRAATTEIMKDTPAFGSGVKPGDILLQIGKTKVHEPEDVIDASFFISAGDKIPITVLRGNEKLTFEIEADLHPNSRRSPILNCSTCPPRTFAEPNVNQAIPLGLDATSRTP